MIRQLLSLVLGLLLVSPAWAAPSQVQRYFQELRSLRADFSQSVYDDRARVMQSASGRMLMQKPGKFRWDYRAPAEQIIVADGARLWAYDVGLAQVTVRKLDKALSSTPLALLTGEVPLEETFDIGMARQAEGLTWYDLTPKQPQPEFRLLRVGFKGELLVSLEMEDGFGQRTRLDFQKLERNPPLDPALLKFTPPPGVDVVGDAG
ncbi:MAG: outer membrane lipoprotein chaperone LolA [Candidatus Competibacter denitrificans]|uniref:Outer-membrane lipoprotein carrier protein n=1 Tax=Candidatus Competibacter denitrificans Run_A_D11 TaxID=1400863 RepID=W6M7M3_9GAMM|nr:outer membrane lipoprotein chaperone LolA [Candidatus Competibacter denitrificans]CDI03642.1 putative Outer-membrane lipoprotein carrier protein [Candidatus Competibacter denitrificans Run_A_D11]HRC69268.1 outer membrane lipoprotein chaperone LolA [Candidatus Competibacter denitrificans]